MCLRTARARYLGKHALLPVSAQPLARKLASSLFEYIIASVLARAHSKYPRSFFLSVPSKEMQQRRAKANVSTLRPLTLLPIDPVHEQGSPYRCRISRARSRSWTQSSLRRSQRSWRSTTHTNSMCALLGVSCVFPSRADRPTITIQTACVCLCCCIDTLTPTVRKPDV